VPSSLDDRERRWIGLGGAALAALAGWVNAVVLTRYAVPVSHTSGAVSRMGGALAVGELDKAAAALLLVVAFFAGATASGVLIGSSSVQIGRRYGVVLMLEGAVLALATLALSSHPIAAAVLAALACGMQNAMASAFRGLVLRTTHVTGIVTDLGLLVGHRLRGQAVETWRIGFLGQLLGGFAVGGVVGAWLEVHLGPAALALASAGAFGAGAAYFVWRHRSRRRR